MKLEDIFSMPIVQHWGYLVLFLVTFVEAMPFGIFVPGHTLIIVAGFLAREGVFSIGWVIAVASLGAIAGDILGYLIGKRYGYPFITKHGYRFFLKKERFEKFRKLLHKHAAKAIIVGRYSPATRSFVPFIAGASHLAFRRFILPDIIGGVSWTLSAVLIGFVFGQGYEAASKYFNRVFAIAIIAVIAAVYIWWAVRNRDSLNQKG
jgi:undecaprenyl-diphosphatase